jgi:hypothetical protein
MAGVHSIEKVAPYVAPLCPAGHLPHKGGDRQLRWRHTPNNVWRNPSGQLISPLVGEMSGRTEGGNVEHPCNQQLPEAHP